MPAFERVEPISTKGPAFHVLPAFLVAGGSAIISIAAAALDERIGRSGPIVASGIAGFVDAHSTTGALASLHHSGRLGAAAASLAIVVALTTNSFTKILMAVAPGGKAYAIRISLGVVAIALSAWVGSSWSTTSRTVADDPRVSSSGVPEAIRRPWSMMCTWSASCSASPR